jgi:hypothetical protein
MKKSKNTFNDKGHKSRKTNKKRDLKQQHLGRGEGKKIKKNK